jgi:hypothetical protein
MRDRAVNLPESGIRLWLRQFWKTADARHDDLLADSDPASIAIWAEAQAREREERTYLIVERAVLWGVLKAGGVLFLLWFVVQCAAFTIGAADEQKRLDAMLRSTVPERR